MTDSSLATAENILGDILIPPQPDILTSINYELEKEDPDINKISDKIMEDGGLYSSILKLINSPYFGMRTEIKTIPHAISLIGLTNLASNIASIKFRAEMNSAGYVSMPRYWDNVSDRAKLCSFLSNTLHISVPSEAYTVGLFKDAGIPILAQKYEDYKDTLKAQNDSELENYTDLEDEKYNTNHCIVGYLMTKQWGLKQRLRDACLYHHDIAYMTDKNFDHDPEVRNLILISKIAGFVANSNRDEPEHEGLKIKEFTLYYFGLSEHDFFEIKEEMLDHLSTA